MTPTRKWPFWCIIAVFFFVFIYLIRGVLLPFVLGTFIAYFLHPLVDRLQKAGISRGLASVAIIGGFFISITLLSLFIIPVIATQCSDLLLSLPGYVTEFEHKYLPLLSKLFGDVTPAKNIEAAVSDVSGMMFKLTGEFLSGLFHSGMAFLTILSLILITPIVAIYLLRDWEGIVKRFDRLLPREHEGTIRGQLAIIDRTLAGFVRGQLTVCLVLAGYYSISLSVIGLKFGIIVGLATGFLVIFPYIGVLLCMATAFTLAMLQFDDYGHIGAVLGVYIIGQIAEGYVITPKLVGEKVGLHPVWIIFGMLSGAALFGFVGILLAVPATAVIGVLIRFAIDRYLQSDYYKGGISNPQPTRR